MADYEASSGATREQRALPRASLKRCAKLSTANGAAMDIRTADVSLGGMGVIADIPLVPGQSCMVQFEASINNPRKQMLMRGTVAFCLLKKSEGFRIGIRAGECSPDLVHYIDCLFEPSTQGT